MNNTKIAIEPGKPLPLGASIIGNGVNFSIFSRHGTSVTLLIFEKANDNEPIHEINLDLRKNRTGDIWHCFVRGISEGAFYAYRVDGPYIPEKGFRFNPHKILLDPYAKAITKIDNWDLVAAQGYNPNLPDCDLSFSYVDNITKQPKCIVVSDFFDWEGDRPLNYPLRFSILYETHIRGFTIHPSANVKYPGTYKGAIEKISYLKDLGITSIEFLPVQEYNHNENNRLNPRTGEVLRNYWGYSTVSFFAPKQSYSSDNAPGAQVKEFKEMVREYHKAGIEIILDIVFNHTAEGNERGPTISFRGLDNSIYYILDENRRFYKNFSGCGNTLNCNHPVVRSFIMDCLRYWVVEMHVDGFRFDLGSILGRDQQGRLMENPPMLERIAEDPVLRNTKIIAEAWDAGGAYQVGWFPGGRWAEWNDRYRDDVRKFWRGDTFAARNFATRLSGSSDLYLRDGRKPFHSINFITSHDGFTLVDLVSYSEKHNDENGENNNDGNNHNYSSNYGFEGSASNPSINSLREKQIKNFLATLLLSLGTPMLLGGDEFKRTQRGNNNAYSQDNEISWYDWRLVEKNKQLRHFLKGIIEFRKKHPAFLRPEFYSGKDGNYNAIPDITWFSASGETPDWSTIDKQLAVRIDGSKADTYADRDDCDFFLMFNSADQACRFIISNPANGGKWYKAIDTALPSAKEVLEAGQEQCIANQTELILKERSLVVLISKVS